MNLEEALLFDMSRRNIDILADEWAWDKERIQETVDLIFAEQKLSMRAAWLLEACFHRNPGFISDYLERFIKAFGNFKDSGIDRNISKILMRIELPEDSLGTIWEKCYKMLFSSIVPVAIRANAMQILYNISNEEPELKSELLQAIEELIDEGGAGFKSRGNKLIQKLRKELQ